MSRLSRVALATVYLTYVLTQGSILDYPRQHVLRYTFMRRLLNCPLCTGLWAAIIVSYAPLRFQEILAAAGVNLIVWSRHDG